MDFTIEKYRTLLKELQGVGYTFRTFTEYLSNPLNDKVIILRHDVDLLPLNSLRTAKIENGLGIEGSYYFRAVPESWDENVIRQIHALGHEVGYHYESLTTTNGNIPQAYNDFCSHLKQLRELVPVSTVCMHGSPRSPYDSKDIWEQYSYKELDILGEPYLNTDFSKMFYLTDTGRRWDGYKVSVRDKIEGWQERWDKQGLRFHSTSDILKALRESRLPQQLMITVHPQRWNPTGVTWLKELVLQNLKNAAKRILIKTRK
jgi:hypothetical protein